MKTQERSLRVKMACMKLDSFFGGIDGPLDLPATMDLRELYWLIGQTLKEHGHPGITTAELATTGTPIPRTDQPTNGAAS